MRKKACGITQSENYFFFFFLLQRMAKRKKLKLQQVLSNYQREQEQREKRRKAEAQAKQRQNTHKKPSSKAVQLAQIRQLERIESELYRLEDSILLIGEGK
jgi:hypothetical protein